MTINLHFYRIQVLVDPLNIVMVVRLRLARGGRKKLPHYSIVATDIRSPRDSSFLEKIGYFDPLAPKDNVNRCTLNKERVQYWLKVGAKPSPAVSRLLKKNDCI